MGFYRKKPVVIEAIQWDGSNISNVNIFFGKKRDGQLKDYSWDPLVSKIYIHTLEGTLEATQFDWIIKGVKGEFYPCKPDIFEATYEAV